MQASKRTRAWLAAVLLCLLTGWLAADTATEPAEREGTPTPIAAPRSTQTFIDEQQVRDLIKAMGNDDYATREAAHKKLMALGPAVVPALQPHRAHEDPEIAERVSRLVDSYAWLQRGVMVLQVNRGSTAEKGGVRVGDVVVRVGDVDVVSFPQYTELPFTERIDTIWRGGELIEVKRPAGPWGVFVSNWEMAKGGSDHARGIAALTDPATWSQAHERLLAAQAQGMDDRWSLLALAGLEEYSHNHARARKLYAAIRAGDTGCFDTHKRLDEHYHNLPMSSSHTRYLLDRWIGGDESPNLLHQLEDYFSLQQPNVELLRALVKDDWPFRQAVSYENRWYAVRARMMLAMFEGRYQDVVDLWEQNGQIMPLAGRSASALVLLRKHPEAARMAIRILTDGESNFPAWYAAADVIASLAIDGEESLLRLVLNVVSKLPSGRLDALFDVQHSAWLLPPAAHAIGRAVNGRHDAFRSVDAQQMYLKLIGSLPEMTWAAFDEQFHAMVGRDSKNWSLQRERVLMMLRFGMYDEVVKLIVSKKIDSYHAGIIRPICDFMLENKGKVAGEWSALAGAVQLARDRKHKDLTFIRRWDNRVFLIDGAGKLTETAGLPPLGPRHTSLARHLEDTPQGMSLRNNGEFGRVFLFDDASGRWIDALEHGRMVDMRDKVYNAELLARIHMRKLRGPEAEPTASLVVRTIGRNWVWAGQREQVGFLVKRVPPVLIDLPKLIADKLGRDVKTIEVYQPYAEGDFKQPGYDVPDKEDERPIYVPTNFGLWRFDEKSEGVARVPLPVKNPDVRVVLLSWPKRAGKSFVGVVPQDGGQIFEVDHATHEVRLTSGYNGAGPVDGYYWFSKSHMRLMVAQLEQRWFERAATKPARQ